MVIKHVFLIVCRNRNFIGKPPCHNTCVVVILQNQLPHLCNGVCTCGWDMFRNIWNFCPHNHSLFITEIIEILVMLVMRQTNRICPNLLDQLHILFMLFLRNRIADSLKVLMTRYTMKWVWLSIQIKAFIRVYGK